MSESSLIFVSYSWMDSDFARNVVSSLEKQGYDVWIDYKNLNINESIAFQIKTAIIYSDVILLIDSQYSASSSWVKFEIELANLLGKSVYVIHAQ
jgi:hypothetical protein